MGQFIETQSQLVSEAKQARLERQQIKRNKANIEYAKNRLKSYFLTAFETNSLYDKDKNIYYNFNNAKETYLKLLNTNIKDNIIYSVIDKEFWENIELVQAIDNLYISQLKKAYFPYKEIYTEQQKQEKETIKKLYRQRQEIQKQQQEKEKHKYDYLLNNGEELEPIKEKNKTWLIYGLGIPILAASCFIKNTIKPKRGKRRH